ncbi:hypothetical protein [Peribacillus butanolivorans]
MQTRRDYFPKILSFFSVYGLAGSLVLGILQGLMLTFCIENAG